ncbi:hypothetical protein ACP70R_020941 [Stipagrostis hirtigluma subsp. patula]
MDESERPVRQRQRRRMWITLSHIGLPLRADHPPRVRHIRRPQDDHRPEKELPCPLPVLDGSSRLGTSPDSAEVPSSELSRFKLLSLDDLTPTMADSTDRHDGGDSDEESIYEGTSVIHGFQSDDDDSGKDEDGQFDDPFLEDGFGNITNYRLSDLRREFSKHIEDVSSKPKTREKKMSKEEKLKLHSDRMEQYMKSALKKYNKEENLDEDLCFEFVKAVKENFIVEGCYMFYHHFNFAAMQADTRICLFFAEVIPDDGDICDVTCCKLLTENDNEICLCCKNQGDPNLRHPASDKVYIGGHTDSKCPFLLESDSEDDSD